MSLINDVERILIEYVGETDTSEGLIEVLERLIAELEEYRKGER